MVSKQLKQVEQKIETEVKYVTAGAEIYFAILGTTVSGILVGRTLWEWSSTRLGLSATLVLGLALFALTGFYLGKFKRK